MHGKLTALVRYHLRYQLTGLPVIISFGLGADVAVNSIIGLPTLRQWGGLLDFNANKFVATSINTQFPILYEPTKQGLPPSITFNESMFTRPGSNKSFMGSALMTNIDESTTPKTKLVTFAPSEAPTVTDTGIGACFKREVNIPAAK